MMTVEELINEINELPEDQRDELLEYFPVKPEVREKTLSIPLETPIKFGAREEIHSLDLKAPNFLHIKTAREKAATKTTDMEMLNALQENLIMSNTGLTIKEVELLPYEVVEKAFTYLNSFTLGARRTSKR